MAQDLLKKVYASQPALLDLQFKFEGCETVVFDETNSVLGLLRKGTDPTQNVLCLLNNKPAPLEHYRVGVDAPGEYRELINTDAREYGGSGWGNRGGVVAVPAAQVPNDHGKPFTLVVTLPPAAAIAFKRA